ncbi:hypothetical protein SK128_008805 [Halocaridina rubra]|uniref:Reverse transcriptase domain-containing protein n=1 Tax=Halocaridina rubra TaxID=373956 RepID=A0AAN9A378_HALRR
MLKVKKRNGSMTEKDVETANELNQAFQGVSVNESDLNVPDFGDSGRQDGFRSKRSTATNLVEYFEALTKAVDMQILVDVNYLDCRRAFDTVPHRRLVNCMVMVLEAVCWGGSGAFLQIESSLLKLWVNIPLN